MSRIVALGIVCIAAAAAWWLLTSTSGAPLSHTVATEQPAAATPTAVTADAVRNNSANDPPPVHDAAADEPSVTTREEVLPPNVPAGPLLQLRVLDASTGLDLSDVLVVAMEPEHPEYWGVRPSHMDKARVVVEHGVSPLPFPAAPGRGLWHYFVRTPRHAWGAFSVRGGDTTVHEVRLERGGDVEVAFTGATPLEGSVLRVRGTNSRPNDPLEYQAQVPASGTVLVEGLATEPFVFTVEKGWSEPVVFGRAEYTVVAGRSHIRIHVDYVAEPPRVRAAGRLTISPACTVSGMWFEARGTARPWHPERTSFDVATMQRVSDTEYLWDAGMLTVGWYRVGFEGANYWTQLEVGPTDDTGHHIVVPEPCEVLVRVVDAATEQLISAWNQRLRWIEVPPEDVDVPTSTGSREKLVNGAFRFLALPGGVRLFSRADGYRDQSESVEVKPGRNEFTLRARPDFGIEVALRFDGVDVPWQPKFRGRLLDEADKPVRGGIEGRFRPASSGRQRLALEELGDYEADPVLVDVPEAGWVRVVVPVRRR